MESKKVFKVFFLMLFVALFTLGTAVADNRPRPRPNPPCCPPGDINVGVGVNTQLDLGDTNVNVGGPSVNVGGSPVNVSNGSSSRSSSSSRSNSEANNSFSLRMEDERDYLPGIAINFPGLLQSDNLPEAGPMVWRVATVVRFLPDGRVSPQEAKNIGKTKYWTFSGKYISTNWLRNDKPIPEKQRSEDIIIRIAEEDVQYPGETLGFVNAVATRNKVDSVDLIFSAAYESWRRGANVIVVTAEGFERVRKALSLGVGFTSSSSHAGGSTGNVSSGGIGATYGSAWNNDRPWLHFTAIRW